MTHIPDNVAAVCRRIATAAQRTGRRAEDITLVTVTKTRTATEIRAAADAGQRDFGESYLQEANGKMDALRELGLTWHFIGPIQSNKTRDIASAFDWVHSVDRLKIARRLSDQRSDALAPLQVCLQVNVSGEASKSGADPRDVANLADEIAVLPRVRLRGLMSIPAPAPDFEAQRRPFRQLRELADDLRAQGHEIDTLSMGMTDDLEAAIAEGATIVRVGTAIFGPREPNA